MRKDRVFKNIYNFYILFADLLCYNVIWTVISEEIGKAEYHG